MNAHVEHALDKIEHTAMDSRRANVACSVGGAALLVAGGLLDQSNALAGLAVESIGFVGFAMGVWPPILRWFGLEPPRQNHESPVE